MDSRFVSGWMYFACMAFDPWISEFFQDVGRIEQKISHHAGRNRLGFFNYCLPAVCLDASECVFGMDQVVTSEDEYSLMSNE